LIYFKNTGIQKWSVFIMKKIRWMSTAFIVLFVTSFFLLPIYIFLYWLTNGFPFGPYMQISIPLYEGPSLPPIGVLPLETKIYSFLISLLPVSLYMGVLAFLIKIFHLFSRGEILSLNIVILTRRLAWTFLFAQLIAPVYSFLISMIMTWHLRPEYRFAYFGINLQDIFLISISIIVLLISWIIAEYYKINQEQEFTV
jgi:Protein of unknown function (DUF2975)